MEPEIRIHKVLERDIDVPLSRQIVALQRVAFPNEPHFKEKRWVHTLPLPEDPWFHAWENDELAGNVWLHHRTVLSACGPVQVGGIANVCTSPAHRGAGAAKGCMRAASEYMASHPAIEFGLLFCGGTVRKFYESLGWRATENRYLAHHPDGAVQPVHDGCIVMILDACNGQRDWPEGDIDLNGPEW